MSNFELLKNYKLLWNVDTYEVLPELMEKLFVESSKLVANAQLNWKLATWVELNKRVELLDQMFVQIECAELDYEEEHPSIYNVTIKK